MPDWSIEHQRLFDRHAKLAVSIGRKVACAFPKHVFDPGEVDAAALCGLWRAARTWKPQTKFATWLAVCVRSAVRDMIRCATGQRKQNGRFYRVGKSIRSVCSIHAESEWLRNHTEDHFHPTVDDRQGADLDLLDWLDWLLRPLDSISQQLVRLVWYDGQTMRQAGDAVGLSQSAVCLRLKRARPVLVDRLENSCTLGPLCRPTL